jgi:hypothetical protein
MKRFRLSLLATIMLMSSGFGAYTYTKIADTPACCQKHENCCPASACCSGGKHSQCPMMRHHAHT